MILCTERDENWTCGTCTYVVNNVMFIYTMILCTERDVYNFYFCLYNECLYIIGCILLGILCHMITSMPT